MTLSKFRFSNTDSGGSIHFALLYSGVAEVTQHSPLALSHQIMDIDDFNQLADFVFDQSTPESGDDDEAQEPGPEKVCDATSTHDVTPSGRVIRRRARKACVACHKRYFEHDMIWDWTDYCVKKGSLRRVEPGEHLYQLSS